MSFGILAGVPFLLENDVVLFLIKLPGTLKPGVFSFSYVTFIYCGGRLVPGESVPPWFRLICTFGLTTAGFCVNFEMSKFGLLAIGDAPLDVALD